MSAAQPLLVLWDIDHTLVSITGVGREIYARVFEQVTGRLGDPARNGADRYGHPAGRASRKTSGARSIGSNVE